MKEQFSASVWREGEWFVAQCREFEIASQGKTRDEALSNLEEAVEVHFSLPIATLFPDVVSFEAEFESGAA